MKLTILADSHFKSEDISGHSPLFLSKGFSENNIDVYYIYNSKSQAI